MVTISKTSNCTSLKDRKQPKEDRVQANVIIKAGSVAQFTRFCAQFLAPVSKEVVMDLDVLNYKDFENMTVYCVFLSVYCSSREVGGSPSIPCSLLSFSRMHPYLPAESY